MPRENEGVIYSVALQEQRLIERAETDLNRFAARSREGHLALDLYFFMGIQHEKHSGYGQTLSA